MQDSSLCRECGARLDADDIGLYRKLVSRQASSFLCRSCLARYFGTSRAQMERKIQEFKQQGCLLFPQPADHRH